LECQPGDILEYQKKSDCLPDFVEDTVVTSPPRVLRKFERRTCFHEFSHATAQDKNSGSDVIGGAKPEDIDDSQVLSPTSRVRTSRQFVPISSASLK
jgi:hypothetical protein